MAREKFNRMNEALIHWEDVMDDVEALTDEYEESGWETLVLHPGDVVTTTDAADGEPGFRLVVPESELDALAEAVGDGEDAFDEFEVHRAPTDDLSLFVVVVKSTGRGRAVFFPVYYDPDADREFVETARERNTIYTDVTNLNRTRQFSFAHEKPSLFLP